MITYKGDNLVVGKSFIIENETFTYKTKNKQGYIFESTDRKLVLSEDDVVKKGLK